jgi:hypothetical protein
VFDRPSKEHLSGDSAGSNRFSLELACPQCGGSFFWIETDHQKYCPYCASLLYFEQHRKNYWYIEPRITTPQQICEVIILNKAEKMRAEKVAMLNESRRSDDKPLMDIMEIALAPFLDLFRHKIVLESYRLIYAPYYLMKGIVYQCLLGQDERGSKEYGLHRIPVSETIPAYADALWNFRDRGIHFGAVKLKQATQEMLSGANHIAFESNVISQIERTAGHAMPKEKHYETFLFKQNVLCDERAIPVLRPYWFVTCSADKSAEALLLDASFDSVAGYPLEGELQRFETYSEKPLCEVEIPRVTIVTSRCPECGSDCRWLPHQLIHICKNCNRGLALNDDEIKTIPYQFGRDTCAKPIFLPFWKVRVSLELRSTKYDRLREYFLLFYQERLLKVDPSADSIYFPAFATPADKKGDDIFSAAALAAVSEQWDFLQGPAPPAIQVAVITASRESASDALPNLVPSLSGVPPGLHKMGSLTQMLKQTKILQLASSLVLLPFEQQDQDVILAGKRISLKLLEFA